VVGILLTLADWCYFHALAQAGVAISIISLIRRSNVVLSFTFGALLFHEGNLKRKSIALAAMSGQFLAAAQHFGISPQVLHRVADDGPVDEIARAQDRQAFENYPEIPLPTRCSPARCSSRI